MDATDATREAPGPTRRRQPYSFGMLYTVVSRAAEIPLGKLFWDPAAVVVAYRRAYEVLPPAFREVPEVRAALASPTIAHFSYGHVSALGAEIEFPEDGEPRPLQLIHSPDDVYRLREPDDYTRAGIVPRRYAANAEVARLAGLARGRDMGGTGVEGPVTTAVLLAGEQFLLWPYERPKLAHDLLSFCTRSAVRYVRAIAAYEGRPWPPARWGIADDFAGLFPPRVFEEFVLPYWQETYELVGARERSLHSELLRPEHLPYLDRLGLAQFDPSADQYLTPEVLAERCPTPFQLRIMAWHMYDLTRSELQDLYCRFASFEPAVISCIVEDPAVADKFLGVVEVARELDGEMSP